MSSRAGKFRMLLENKMARNTLVFSFTFLVSFSVYCSTLLHETEVGDSAELSLQSYQLGVAHPPGYPVYIFLGNMLCKMVANPMIATNLLSAIATSFSVGVLSLIILRLTDFLYAALLAPLVFAFSAEIWEFAVLTEVYSVNILFLSLSLFFIIQWDEDKTKKYLILSAIIYGISFGTYLANVLLCPAFAFLLFYKNKKWFADIVLFGMLTAVFAVSVVSFSYFRSKAFPPMGAEYMPGSLDGTLKYFQGYQYSTLRLHGSHFYRERISEHTWIFLRNIFFIGVIPGVYGLISMWRQRRALAIFLIVLFVINISYFTNYSVAAYYTMVNPSYFVFCIFIGYGAWTLCTQNQTFGKLVVPALILICIGNLVMQFSERLARSNSLRVTRFATDAFKEIPFDAVVVCEWDYYTTLSYFQKVFGYRTDCRLIEFAQNKRRYYQSGPVDSYSSYVLSAAKESRPIVIDSITNEYLSASIKSKFQVSPFYKNWYYLKPLNTTN